MGQGHEFEQRVGPIPNEVSEDELVPLLHELNEAGSWNSDTCDTTTVAAVAEATGHSEAYVQETLERMRDEDLQARLAQTLREMEEPLYRVERPGHTPNDPIMRQFQLRPGESLSPLLDSLAKKSAKKKLTAKKLSDSTDVGSKIMANVIMFLFTALIVVTVCIGLNQLLK